MKANKKRDADMSAPRLAGLRNPNTAKPVTTTTIIDTNFIIVMITSLVMIIREETFQS
jgi:hypothetical protein